MGKTNQLGIFILLMAIGIAAIAFNIGRVEGFKAGVDICATR